MKAAVGCQDSYGAERLAKDQNCNAQPSAVLMAKGAGIETYSVACTSGDVPMVRCELGRLPLAEVAGAETLDANDTAMRSGAVMWIRWAAFLCIRGSRYIPKKHCRRLRRAWRSFEPYCSSMWDKWEGRSLAGWSPVPQRVAGPAQSVCSRRVAEQFRLRPWTGMPLPDGSFRTTSTDR